MNNQKKNNWYLFLIILFIVLFDQVTKTWAFLNLQKQDSFSGLRDVIIIKDIFRFTYVENPGIAFGIRIGNELFLTLFATIACLALFVLIYKSTLYSEPYRYAIGIILGGAIGNLIDRFIYGKVIDFIYLEIIDWPVFNVADIAVTIGMLFGIIQIFIASETSVVAEAEDEKVVWIDGEKIPSDEVIR